MNWPAAPVRVLTTRGAFRFTLIPPADGRATTSSRASSAEPSWSSSACASVSLGAYSATSPAGSAEAETQIISPGSSITTPAGEGDQLDKVFEATRQREAEAAAKAAEEGEAPEASTEAPAEPKPEATFAEHPIPEPPTPSTEAKADLEVTEAATIESPEAKPAEPASESPAADSGDAGDMLEAEREHLASHPTEHYDVDAAIAEEDEIDVLSESSLSDELDRALESGEVASAGETAQPGPAVEEDSGEIELDEPGSTELEAEADSAEHEAADEDENDGSGDFFDQEDPLEGTPDFLEETPEHDQLWFEQKEPKDFDFGD